MLSRRALLAAAATVAAPGLLRAAEPTIGDDGLYHQPWFLESFLELGDDLSAAAAKGKHLVVLWELKGCPACRQTHLVNFADAAIATFVRERFEVLQLNILGAREVTDFDGQRLGEKRFAEKYAVRSTPTFQFFPLSADGLAARPARDREIARAQGYLEPQKFLAMFRFIAERRYESGALPDFLRGLS